jgi:hypothetical protein
MGTIRKSRAIRTCRSAAIAKGGGGPAARVVVMVLVRSTIESPFI